MLAQNSNIYIHLAPGMVNVNNISSDANSLTHRTNCTWPKHIKIDDIYNKNIT
jgi:hypothetical protein